jgi:uncharacterized membrane protein YbhN (UPF0104 family)
LGSTAAAFLLLGIFFGLIFAVSDAFALVGWKYPTLSQSNGLNNLWHVTTLEVAFACAKWSEVWPWRCWWLERVSKPSKRLNLSFDIYRFLFHPWTQSQRLDVWMASRLWNHQRWNASAMSFQCCFGPLKSVRFEGQGGNGSGPSLSYSFISDRHVTPNWTLWPVTILLSVSAKDWERLNLLYISRKCAIHVYMYGLDILYQHNYTIHHNTI